jgi:repressor LexA
MAKQKEERKEKILRFVNEFINEKGYSPSIREIGANIGISSTSLVDYYLSQLQNDGFITTAEKHVSRSVRLTLAGYETIGVNYFDTPAGIEQSR